MTTKQEKLYTSLRRKLIYRGIKKNLIPTAARIPYMLNNQKIYRIIDAFIEGIKNLDAWEDSYTFRQACYEKYGSDFSIKEEVFRDIYKRFLSIGYLYSYD